VVVDNRPGANNTIGMALLAKAPPDGYTIGFGSTSPLSSAPAMMQQVPYDPIKDFEPITQYARSPMVLVVNSALGVRSVAQLITLAKQKPGQLNYASNGPASSLHVMGELFRQAVGIDVLHVPYKAIAQSLTAILANEAQFGFDFALTCAQHVKAGKLNALFTTGEKRIPVLPDVPTAEEVGYSQLKLILMGGFLAPAGTSKAIIARLNAELAKILHSAEVKAEIEKNGDEAVGNSPEEFREVIIAELARWKQIVAQTGVKME